MSPRISPLKAIAAGFCSPALLCVAIWLLASTRAAAADTLVWNTNQNLVSADLKSVPLDRFLEDVVRRTSWDVYVEPNLNLTVSAKFQDLPPGEALRLMLGNLNFALIPQQNQRAHLYVFQSSRGNATQRVSPALSTSPTDSQAAKRLGKELLIRIKPGADIDEIARRVGAKIVGRIDELGIYRLQFSDEESAASARTKLAGDDAVASVDSNYVMESPPSVARLNATSPVPPVDLKLNPSSASGGPVIGLIDTAVQSLGNDLDKFIVKKLTVTGESTIDSAEPSHGTSMFQHLLRAASDVTGGSSSLQVVTVNAFDSNGNANMFDVMAAMVLAVNNKANILSLSLGSRGDSVMFQDLIREITSRGIPVFAAAGNEGSSSYYYPAAYPQVTAVTAAAAQGKLASYANYGNFVDLMAPGAGIIYYHNIPYISAGTSTSTAYIAGATAGLADKKGVSVTEAANAIRSSPTFQFTPPR